MITPSPVIKRGTVAPEHYVDNKKFYTEMVKYISAYNNSVDNDLPLPKIPNYIGECISKIANRLSFSRNFIGYSYRDEMISDGIENCILYLNKFNPDKYDNPFSYFTQINYYAFIRRIQKEQKQQYIKHKSLINASVMNELVEMSADDSSHFQAVYTDMGADKANEMVDKYETTLRNKKDKPKKGVDKFIGDDNEQN